MDRNPRVVRPDRKQLRLEPVNLDARLSADHRARLVWAFVESLDLGPLYDQIESVEGHAGRPAIDPAVLLALWLYATIEGVGSARRLSRLCEEHDAYRWICGGIEVSPHTLSDFRSQNAETLERLLVESVAALVAEGLVSLRRVSQDGMRVRACAGAASFRRASTLERCLAEAEEQVAALREELDGDPGGRGRQEAAAQERAARTRVEQVKRAKAQLEEIHEEKAKRGRKRDQGKELRASTTDPEARIMRMADGGYRPAYNAQLTTDCETQVIVGVDVTNQGTDKGWLRRTVSDVEDRYGVRPASALADGGFQVLDEIEALEKQGTKVYLPPPEPRLGDRSRYRPLPGDSEELARWRRRMGRASAKEVYKQRAAVSECVNAQQRQRGLLQFLVRGRERVRAVLLLQGLAHNLLRSVVLREPTGASP
jgi:transposase